MRPLQRQELILNHFKDYIPRPIHAIDLKCMTPAQAETAGDTVFHSHCGFSNRAAQVLQSMGGPFASVNILSDPRAIPSVCA
jgi:hypothetical protein